MASLTSTMQALDCTSANSSSDLICIQFVWTSEMGDENAEMSEQTIGWGNGTAWQYSGAWITEGNNAIFPSGSRSVSRCIAVGKLVLTTTAQLHVQCRCQRDTYICGVWAYSFMLGVAIDKTTGRCRHSIRMHQSNHGQLQCLPRLGKHLRLQRTT